MNPRGWPEPGLQDDRRLARTQDRRRGPADAWRRGMVTSKRRKQASFLPIERPLVLVVGGPQDETE